MLCGIQIDRLSSSVSHPFIFAYFIYVCTSYHAFCCNFKRISHEDFFAKKGDARNTADITWGGGEGPNRKCALYVGI